MARTARRPRRSVLAVQWGNPYSAPPAGANRVLWSVTVLDDAHRRELEALTPPYPLGSGYAFCWSPIPEPVGRLPAGTKARLRRNNLKKRLERDAPHFAEQFYADELRRRAPYFAGEDIISPSAKSPRPGAS